MVAAMPLHSTQGLGSMLCSKDVNIKGEIWEVAGFLKDDKLTYSLSNVGYACNIFVGLTLEEFQAQAAGSKCDRDRVKDMKMQASKAIDYIVLTEETEAETGKPIAELRFIDVLEEKKLKGKKSFLEVDVVTGRSECGDVTDSTVAPMPSIEADDPQSCGEDADPMWSAPAPDTAMLARAAFAQGNAVGSKNKKLCLFAEADNSTDEGDEPVAADEVHTDLGTFSCLKDPHKWKGHGKSWGLAFRKGGKKQMLRWQTALITQPLTNVLAGEKESALHLFGWLSKFTDDKFRFVVDPMQQIREAVQTIGASQTLRSEFYVQILKQMNGNPHPRKVYFLFHAIHFAIQLLEPCEELIPHIRSRVIIALKRCSGLQEKRMFNIILEDLEKFSSPAGPKSVPAIGSFWIQVALMDGTAKMVRVCSDWKIPVLTTTVRDELNLSVDLDWTMFQAAHVGQHHKPLPSTASIGEVMEVWEKSLKRTPGQHFWFLFKRLSLNAKEKIPTTKPDDLHFTYHQAATGFRECPDIKDDVSSLLMIGSHMLYLESSMYEEEINDTKYGLEEEGVLETFAPRQLLKAFDRRAVSRKLIKSRAPHFAESRTVAYSACYRALQRLKVFGCTLRKVKQVMNMPKNSGPLESKFLSFQVMQEKRKVKLSKPETGSIGAISIGTQSTSSVRADLNIQASPRNMVIKNGYLAPQGNVLPHTSVTGKDLLSATTGAVQDVAVLPSTPTGSMALTPTETPTPSQSSEGMAPSASEGPKLDRTMQMFTFPRWAWNWKGTTAKGAELKVVSEEKLRSGGKPELDRKLADITSARELAEAAAKVPHFTLNPENTDAEYILLVDPYGVRLLEPDGGQEYAFMFHDTRYDHIVAVGVHQDTLQLVCGIVSKVNENGEVESRETPVERRFDLTMKSVTEIYFLIYQLFTQKMAYDENLENNGQVNVLM